MAHANPTRFLTCVLASGLAIGCASARKGAAAAGEFSPEFVYVVETKGGEIFSTRIDDFLARAEVGTIRQQGKTADGRDIPGAVQTRP
jgi:hypothetical protein